MCFNLSPSNVPHQMGLKSVSLGPWDPGKRRFLREIMDTNDLIDVPFKGQRFTWSNNWPGDDLIKIRGLIEGCLYPMA